jgi:hypothetical protein
MDVPKAALFCFGLPSGQAPGMAQKGRKSAALAGAAAQD